MTYIMTVLLVQENQYLSVAYNNRTSKRQFPLYYSFQFLYLASYLPFAIVSLPLYLNDQRQ